MTGAGQRRLRESAAADRLGVTPKRLRRWRLQGDAPPHDTRDEGEPVYPLEDLVAWREHYVFPPGEVDPPNRAGDCVWTA